MATGKEILNDAKQKMAKSGDALQRTLADIRAGQANASLLNSVKVEYYGAPTPLNQVASITIPEARQLLITPYDESVLEEIEKAIYASNLGLTPQNDGSSIRLIIPQLTEDRRKEFLLGKHSNWGFRPGKEPLEAALSGTTATHSMHGVVSSAVRVS